MKKLLFLLLLPVYCYSQDSTEIRQTIFPSLGKYGLVTNNGSLYDSVIHGSLEFIESQKAVEYNKALARRKAIFIVKAKCHK